MKCKNCKEELGGQENFCSNCGQKNIEKLNMRYIIGEFVDNLFNLDSKFFITLKLLILKPGFLSKEYMEGKRASFVPPIRLYIVLSVLFFFLISIVNINIHNEEETNLIEGSNIVVNDVVLDASLDELKKMEYKGTLDNYIDSVSSGANNFARFFTKKLVYAKINGNSFTDVLLNQVSLFLLIFIPLLALLYGVCFSRKMYGYIGHIVFNLHLNSFIILILIFDRLIRPFIATTNIDIAWSSLVFIVGQIYLVKAVMHFYERKWWIALYKYLLLIFGYAVLAFLFFILVVISSLIVS